MTPQGCPDLLRSDVARYLLEGNRPGVRMVRIGLRPTWVGTPDFRTRFPQSLAGSAR